MPNENLIQFLRTNLIVLLSQERKDGRKWSHRSISEESYDLYALEITSGGVGNDTIGRFLDASSQQKPSKKTLDIVSQILIYHKQVKQSQLDNLQKMDKTSYAIIPIDVFKIPKTNALSTYLGNLSGNFHTAVTSDQHLAISCLRIEFLEEVFAIRIKEEIRIFNDPVGFSNFANLSDNIDEDAQIIQRALTRKGLHPKDSLVFMGFAVANTSFFTSIIQSIAGQLISLALVGVKFDDDDSVIKIKTERNLGWGAIVDGDTTNELQAHALGLVQLLRNLTKTNTFYKNNSDIDNAIENFEEKDDLFSDSWETFNYANKDAKYINKFNKTFNELSIYDNIVGVNIDHNNEDELLIKSLENRDLAGFIAVLDAGGNPNLKWPSENNPMIFDLAANGMTAWVKALLNCGRCNLLGADENGLPPSHKPGVMAIEFGPSAGKHYDPSLYQRYQELADLLVAEEVRQLSVVKKPFKPSPC